MQKKIGVVGFGLVGRSYVDFFLRHRQDVIALLFKSKATTASMLVWDQKPVGTEQAAWLHEHNIVVMDKTIATMSEFIDHCDVVLVVPGVDISGVVCQEKLVGELDLFAPFFKGTSIAITGTLGKTTITSLIASLVSRIRGNVVPAIGNIGKPLLYALDDQPPQVVAELSSFQLERSQSFVPDVAVFTNLYPNHLDRHGTMEEYFIAKWHLLSGQRAGQTAILPWSVFTGVVAERACRAVGWLRSSVIVVAAEQRELLSFAVIPLVRYSVVCLQKNKMVLLSVVDGVVQQEEEIIALDALPEVTFLENWLMVFAALYGAGVPLATLRDCSLLDVSLQWHGHRLEHFATVKAVDFYDDSKATVAQATQAAAQKLAGYKRPITVILGGLGKGVDRSGLLTALQMIPEIKKVYSFGAERATFAGTESYETLEALLDALFVTMQPGDQVLFSPSGASFDLFKNYEHRGDVFKELVLKKAAQLNS